MKHLLKPVFLMFFSSGIVYSQKDVMTTGGGGTGAGGSITYSIGQVAYETASSPSGTVSQGVQQAYEIYTVGIDNYANIVLGVSVFPNPTADQLNLTVVNHPTSGNLAYALFDLSGKLLGSAAITMESTTISMSDLPVASYFLRVSADSREIKTFKIIKN